MAGPQYVYHMQGLTKVYPGGKKVFENIHLNFLPDAKIGVVGVNGSGKSTLLRIMAGQDKEFNGEAWAAEGVKVGYLPQEPKLDPDKNVFDNIAAQCPEKQMLDKFNEISGRLGEEYSDELMEEMTSLQEQIDAADAWDIDSKIEMAMNALRCPENDADVTKLSGGEIRRVAICQLLLSKPDMILMDEPTNHLDAETVAWLQNYLINFPGCVILVTHDRYFLDDITSWILELDRGRGVPFQGNYSSWVEQKAKRMEQEAREESGRKRTLAKELEWVRAGQKARQAKSKARINAYEEMAAKAEREQVMTAQIRIPPGPRLGGVVLEAEGLNKAFGENVLIEDLSFKLPPGGIVGVIGPNGAGKSTLFKMILGQEKPDSGTLRVGETVKIGYVDQSRDKLDPNKNVWEEISGGTDVIDLGGVQVMSRAYVGAFNFKGTDQQKKVASCPAVSVTASTSPRCCAAATTFCCSTNRPTTSTWKRCRRWRKVSTTSRAARHHLARPLVPRPHGHAHPRFRGRQPRRMVRGRFLLLPGRQEAPPGRGCGQSEAPEVQEIRPISENFRSLTPLFTQFGANLA